MSVGIGLGMGQGHVTLGHDGGEPGDGGDPSSPSSAPWSIQCWDSLDHVDHLILLPERALTMDSGWLQADLAEILAHSVMNGVPIVTSKSRSKTTAPPPRSSYTSRRRSLESWSLVNPTGQQSSVVALATGVSRKFGGLAGGFDTFHVLGHFVICPTPLSLFFLLR